MGIYLNPRGKTKEQWLKENGKLVPWPSVGAKMPEGDQRYVMWVNNGPFTAAAVAFCQSELDYFARERLTDDREALCYLVPLEKLREEIPSL